MECYEIENPYKRKKYLSQQGRVIEINPMETGNRKTMGCNQMITIIDEEDQITNFIVSSNTYVIDLFQIKKGYEVVFFYDADAAIPLIYPPQYHACFVAERIPGRNWTIGYFNFALYNEEDALKLHVEPSTEVVTRNNQQYMGNIENHTLLVEYDKTTRSIPAQTTPLRIIVLCDQ